VESSAILFALVAVISLFIGLWLGSRQGRAGERNLAEAREAPLREQCEAAKAEIAALKPKAEELTRVTEQLRNEEAKYAQMKADLDTASREPPPTLCAPTHSHSWNSQSSNSADKPARPN